ncbi:MAG: HAMP domain-containing sensor histidine kinase [Asgard group archaeon]|nr:HAMP domain-containing sensor histidine kinase [Asgard group archaeon]
MNPKITDNINEMVLEITDKLTVKSCNKSAIDFFGTGIIDINIGEILHVQGISEIVNDLLEEKRNHYETKFTKNNSEQFFSIVVEPPYLIIHNITTEMVLKQAKMDFVDLLVHEFSTPLTVLEGHLALLQEKITETSFGVSNSINKLKKSVKRLSRLIEQLSVISSMELKDYRVKKEPVHLYSLILEIIEAFGSKAEAKSLNIENRIPGSLYLETDPVLLYRCLENVFSNAVKYSYEKGNVYIHSKEDIDKTTITVKDEGIGINRNEIDRIFERFYRGSEALKNGSTGLGLGLSLVKHSLKLLNGSIEIKSKHRLGTVVSVTIPH